MKSSGSISLGGVPGIGRAFSVSIALIAVIAFAIYMAGRNDRLQQAW